MVLQRKVDIEVCKAQRVDLHEKTKLTVFIGACTSHQQMYTSAVNELDRINENYFLLEAAATRSNAVLEAKIKVVYQRTVQTIADKMLADRDEANKTPERST